MDKKSVAKNYRFLIILLCCMVAGALVGWFFPAFSHGIAFLGKVFINLMFCIVVPLVFASIAGSVANMESRQRAGKIMGTTIVTFVITGAIAAVIMFVLMKIFPPVLSPWADLAAEEVGEHATMTEMIVNFFTAEDFVGLLSRRAMLPLIVFSILFGFSVQMTGGKDSIVGKWLAGLSDVMMKFVQIITYYAPIAFFAIFADLVATYGAEVAKGYGRALLLYYPLCFIYIFTAFPLFARFGGGKGAAKVMFQHLLKPAAVSFGTCSSVATIPTNMEGAEDTGISKDVSEIVLPLGATMHMDGSAMSAIIKVAFLFGMFGMDFGTKEAILAIIVAVFSSVAMSGVPGGGGTGELVLCTIFFPDNLAVAYTVALALGNLVDPPATMVNAAGDYVVSFIVSRYVDGKDWLQKKLHPAKAEKAEE